MQLSLIFRVWDANHHSPITGSLGHRPSKPTLKISNPPAKQAFVTLRGGNAEVILLAGFNPSADLLTSLERNRLCLRLDWQTMILEK